VVGLAVRCGAVKRANVEGGTHGFAVNGPSATLSNVSARALRRLLTILSILKQI
jgi:hypothetical protein